MRHDKKDKMIRMVKIDVACPKCVDKKNTTKKARQPMGGYVVGLLRGDI